MTTFKVCIKPDKKRKDGFYQVFIRVTNNRKIAYIATDKLVDHKGLYKSEVTDPYIVSDCMIKITKWIDRLNRVEHERWSAKEVVAFLREDDISISFSQYARTHIARMIRNGQERTSKNYKLALQHIENYAGSNDISFSFMNSTFLNAWIATMSKTHRAKEMYPICIRQIYKAAILEMNDEERGIIRIKFNPWGKVKIPKADTTAKLAITPQQIRNFFSAEIPESKMRLPVIELGRDVAMMIFCMAGINTIDIFNLKRTDYYDGIIHYNRAKTMHSRSDNAYMEMRVHPILQPLFDKYKSTSGDYLFFFHDKFASADSFNADVNKGIRQLCNQLSIPQDEWYCSYTFRHSWATIAQNNGATLYEVGFGLNHSGYKITRGYVKIDYSPAWELNDKVIELVFFTTINTTEKTEPKQSFVRFSNKYLMQASAYYKGKQLGIIEDIGFNNVDDIIEALHRFIPENLSGQRIMYKIVNMDTNNTKILERVYRL